MLPAVRKCAACTSGAAKHLFKACQHVAASTTLSRLLQLPLHESELPVVAGDDPALRCEPLRISLLELMRGAPEATPPDVFFQRWASMPAGAPASAP